MQDYTLEKDLDVKALYYSRTDAEKRILNRIQTIFESYIKHANDWDMCDICFTMFEEMVKMYKYNARPRIVKDEIYDSLLKNNLYRAAMSSLYHKRFIFDDEYHVGKGNICNGIMTTEDNIHKNFYAKLFGADDTNENVMKFKICNTNGIDYVYLKEMLKNQDSWINTFNPPQKDIKKFALLKQFLNSINDEELRKKFAKIFNELNNLAVYLGYDYIVKRNTNDGDLKIILNRGIVVVGESEANRVKNLYNKSISSAL